MVDCLTDMWRNEVNEYIYIDWIAVHTLQHKSRGWAERGQEEEQENEQHYYRGISFVLVT